MRIRVISTSTTVGLTMASDFEPWAREDTEVSQVCLRVGPASIECEVERALAVPDTLARIKEAEREGVQAVVLDCMADPGILPARESVSIPVVGAAQASMHLAAMLAHNFSVVTVLERSVALFENQAKLYGLGDKMRSVRWVDLAVLELEQNQDALMEGLIDESCRALEEDGAHAILFGCTGMKGCAEALTGALEARGHGGIPVIDPVFAAFKIAEALVDLGLRPSKRSFPDPPPDKVLVGFEALAPPTPAVR